MATVKYEVVAATGKYKQNGEEKTRFAKIGVVMETDKGLRLKLETIPLAWDGWALISPPKDRAAPAKATSKPNTFDDEWQP